MQDLLDPRGRPKKQDKLYYQQYLVQAMLGRLPARRHQFPFQLQFEAFQLGTES